MPSCIPPKLPNEQKETMRKPLARIPFAVRIVGTACVLLIASRYAPGQNANVMGADGSRANSILKLQMNHASISVADINAESDWYIKTLGFSFRAGEKIDQINPMMKGCRLVIPSFQLDLIQYTGSQRPNAPSPVFLQQGYFHLTFTVEDMEAAFNFLQTAGVKMTANRDPQKHIRGIVLNDPEGNEIELSAR
jgi:catechol 2,3-dioxygenase-like lactoylglutathione lyase family enzyme